VKNLRNALHQIADLIADAVEADERDERVRARRGIPKRPPRPLGESTPKEREEARKFLGVG
jgi:hypothetical protein